MPDPEGEKTIESNQVSDPVATARRAEHRRAEAKFKRKYDRAMAISAPTSAASCRMPNYSGPKDGTMWPGCIDLLVNMEVGSSNKNEKRAIARVQKASLAAQLDHESLVRASDRITPTSSSVSLLRLQSAEFALAITSFLARGPEDGGKDLPVTNRREEGEQFILRRFGDELQVHRFGRIVTENSREIEINRDIYSYSSVG